MVIISISFLLLLSFLFILFVIFFDISNLAPEFFIVACNLMNNEMKQFIITSETQAIREVENKVRKILVLG